MNPLRAGAEGLSIQLRMKGTLAGKNEYVEGDKEMTNKEDFNEPAKYFISSSPWDLNKISQFSVSLNF